MIVITETSKVCTLLLGKYHTLQIEIVDFNFEMRREVIIAFALGDTKMCQQWTEAELDFHFF